MNLLIQLKGMNFSEQNLNVMKFIEIVKNHEKITEFILSRSQKKTCQENKDKSISSKRNELLFLAILKVLEK